MVKFYLCIYIFKALSIISLVPIATVQHLHTLIWASSHLLLSPFQTENVWKIDILNYFVLYFAFKMFVLVHQNVPPLTILVSSFSIHWISWNYEGSKIQDSDYFVDQISQPKNNCLRFESLYKQNQLFQARMILNWDRCESRFFTLSRFAIHVLMLFVDGVSSVFAQTLATFSWNLSLLNILKLIKLFESF